jgi:hypothetical protein
LVQQAQLEQDQGGGDADRQGGADRQVTDLAASAATPTPPTMLLTAATTLAPVNSRPDLRQAGAIQFQVHGYEAALLAQPQDPQTGAFSRRAVRTG